MKKLSPNSHIRVLSPLDSIARLGGFEANLSAKETPFRNISEHQINHLARVSRHGGIAFIIIAFTSVGEVYLLDASIMVERFFHDKKQHISYDEVKESGHLIKQGYQPRLAYLDVIDEFYLKEDTL